VRRAAKESFAMRAGEEGGYEEMLLQRGGAVEVALQWHAQNESALARRGLKVVVQRVVAQRAGGHATTPQVVGVRQHG